MIHLGIDPGMTKGAISAVSDEAKIIEYEMFTSWKKGKAFIDRMRLADDILINIEKVNSHACPHPMTAFTFGGSYHGWKAIIETNDYPLIETAPQTWQKKLLGAVPKGMSKKYAYNFLMKRYPHLHFTNKANAEGIIDSICLALYGRFYQMGTL